MLCCRDHPHMSSSSLYARDFSGDNERPNSKDLYTGIVSKKSGYVLGRSVVSYSLPSHGLRPTSSSVQGILQARNWRGLPCPPSGDIPNPGIGPWSLTLQADSVPSEPTSKPKNNAVGSLSLLRGIFPTQKSHQGLLHCRQTLY